MPLYIGVIEDRGINRLYLSSVPVGDDRFETEHVMIDCSDRGRRNDEVAKTDLYILRNVLGNGDVPHPIIVME